MESRKNLVSTLKSCRFCLTQEGNLSSLYDKTKTPKNCISLPLQIVSCVSVEVFPSDRMPSLICDRCRFFMDGFFKFKQICRQADEGILQFIHKDEPIEPIAWPQKLTKIYNSTENKRQIKSKVAQERNASNEEESEDDGNTYNIQIGDGADDDKETLIKVVKAGDKLHITQDEPTVKKKASDITFGKWACTKCDKSYPLQQLLDLHEMKMHRERNVMCNECGKKFFNKYDLMSHKIVHNSKMAFKCMTCDERFKRLDQLKRHEKVSHSDIYKYQCRRCPETFPSREELALHLEEHSSYEGRPSVCQTCCKRFATREALAKHREAVHEKNLEFSCKYCPQRLSSPTKLARHVRSHAGDRPYLCKYCDKSFVKSHHYTRHMRTAHGTATSQRGPFGAQSPLTCEQCGAGFAAQDDLIYHSAKHAAESLTCPLCHERFRRVEDVSDHIKTHVEGSEFLCDLCELVFTSQEKLNKHFAEKHEDEMSTEQDMDDESFDVAPDEEPEDDEDDSENIQVKDAGDHMVIEIKKTDEFLKPRIIYEMAENAELENSSSEEPPSPAPVAPSQNTASNVTVKKAEEIKRNSLQKAESSVEAATKQVKPSKPEPVVTPAANDKSLKLLEQELQELKRSTSQNESKTSSRNADVLRNRRPPLHTSTPKPRPIEEKKASSTKTQIVEKKLPERRPITKENKEPKESKDKESKDKEVKGNNNNNTKDDKEQKETAKAITKNGTERASTDESIRRSSRPSKVKDYAKMVKNTQASDDDSDDDDDEEYKDTSGRSEGRPRRKVSQKPPAPPPAVPDPSPSPAADPPQPRKRGRPRKDTSTNAKVKKTAEEDTDGADTSLDTSKAEEKAKQELDKKEEATTPAVSTPTEQKNSTIVSPTGQTLKKVPIKQLPPGVRPLPLPANARTMGNRQVCEMQIGKKVVKVQKIVMTKTEVEAMAKKGLVEMKDGTIVLKQGIKLNTFDAASIKSSLAEAGASPAEPATKADKPAPLPTKCISDE